MKATALWPISKKRRSWFVRVNPCIAQQRGILEEVHGEQLLKRMRPSGHLYE